MTGSLEKDMNFKVFADNFFTNLALVRALKTRSLWFVGTFRSNRLKGCNLKTEKELKKEGRGASDTKAELMSNMAAVRWFDNKCADTLSSYIGQEPYGEASGYDKKERKKITIPCPAIIKEYNRVMGVVDLLDSLANLYKYPLKSRRWYMYVFYHTILLAVVNSWFWYKRHARLLNKKPMKLSIFQSQIAEALVLVKKTAGRPWNCQLQTSPPAPPKIIWKAVPVAEIRLDGF